MKKILTTFVMTLAVVAMLVSCGGDKAEQKKGKKRADVPSWFMVPPKSADAIYAVGYAKKMKMQMAMTIARTRATDELSRVLATKVTNMTKDFIEEGTKGVGEDEIGDATEFSQTVSKQLTDNTISGSEIDQQEVYELDDGGYEAFVLLKLGLSNFSEKVDEVMKANAAAYAKLQAKKGFDELANEIKALRGDDKDLVAKEGVAEEYED